MHYIIFDTETNNLPRNHSASVEDSDNWPRLSQLSYRIYDEERNLIKRFNKFIIPENWSFPDNDFFREHADINRNINEGVPLIDALKEFITDRKQCKFTICHNVNFDTKIIRAEMFRKGLTDQFNSIKIDTMTDIFVVNFCEILKPDKKGYKWPKLSELHFKLFGCDFEKAHDSDSDVAATTRCFFELVDRNIINLGIKELRHIEKI